MAIVYRKYYLVVRLFKGWEDRLDIFGSCYNTYKSLRYEINPMDITIGVNGTNLSDGEDEQIEDYIKWNLLHQDFQLDELVGDPNFPDNRHYHEYPEKVKELDPGISFEYPFDVFVIKNLTREDTFTWVDKLRVALYQDEVDPENAESSNDLEPTYGDWMAEVTSNLNELKSTAIKIDLPLIDFNKTDFQVN